TFHLGAWRQNRLFVVLDLKMGDLLLNLRLELIRGAPELVQILPDLAGNLRQLLGPKDNEGQKEQENCLGETHPVHHTVVEDGRQSARQRIDERSSQERASAQ